MPTKPGVQAESWGIPGNYISGPFIGLSRQIVIPVGVANEGHRPGSAFPTAAEYWNYWLWTVGELVRWVFLGTNLDDPDAHIVETDANGWIRAQRVIAESTNQPLLSAFLGGASDVGTPAFEATTGDLAAVGFLHDDPANQGLAAFFRSNSVAACTTIINDGAGFGLTVAAANDHGLLVQGNAAAAAGRFEGLGAAPAIEAESGNNAAGVAIDALAQHPDATAINASTNAGATSASEAILAEGFADGVGIRSATEDGYALELSTGGALSSLRFVGLVGDAVGAIDGDLDYNSTRDALRLERGGERHSLWGTQGGNIWQAPLPQTVALPAAFINVAVASMSGGLNIPQQATSVMITVSFLLVTNAGIYPPQFDMQVVDSLAGVILGPYGNIRHTIAPGAPVGTASGPYTFSFRYDLPAAGARDFTLQLDGTTGTGLTATDAMIEVRGLYDI